MSEQFVRLALLVVIHALMTLALLFAGPNLSLLRCFAISSTCLAVAQLLLAYNALTYHH